MARESKRPSRQGPPVQFRPGVELERLVRSFAGEHHLEPNEACKVLAALAVTGMDQRYYGLVRQLAEVIGGHNAFVRACLEIKGHLGGAALVTGKPIQDEPARSLIIHSVVHDALAAQGKQVDSRGLWFLAEHAEPERQPRYSPDLGRARRKIRRINLDEEQLSESTEQQSDAFTGEEQDPPQKVGQPTRR